MSGRSKVQASPEAISAGRVILMLGSTVFLSFSRRDPRGSLAEAMSMVNVAVVDGNELSGQFVGLQQYRQLDEFMQ
jgi:hypothetical protein